MSIFSFLPFFQPTKDITQIKIKRPYFKSTITNYKALQAVNQQFLRTKAQSIETEARKL
jgi:hypothetical protein